MYREFNSLTGKGQMTQKEQIDRIKILQIQVEKASKEGLILLIGDLNIDLVKWEKPQYYLKNVAQEYQTLIGECGLEVIDFGVTFSRPCKKEFIESALDHALVNKPASIKNYFKTLIDYSDHNMICVDLKTNIPKLKDINSTSRDLRKIRNNPQYFKNRLSAVEWEIFINMKDVDEMEEFWTSRINECLDSTAPFKARKNRKKKFCLPKEVQEKIQTQKELQKTFEFNRKNAIKDSEFDIKYKKHRNYTNNLIKKAVRENTGKNITNASSAKEIWSSINDILKPEKVVKNSIKIETNGKTIEDPVQLANEFNNFFKEKVE